MPSLEDWLVGLIQEYDQDPQQCLQNGKPQVHLEKVSSANNDCFWIATAHIDGLEVNWGIQGTSGNRRFFSLDKCRLQNPIMELRKRIRPQGLMEYLRSKYDHKSKIDKMTLLSLSF